MHGSVGKSKGREVHMLMIDYSSVGNLSNDSAAYRLEIWWYYGNDLDEETVVWNSMVFAIEFRLSSPLIQISLFSLSQTLLYTCGPLLVYLWPLAHLCYWDLGSRVRIILYRVYMRELNKVSNTTCLSYIY